MIGRDEDGIGLVEDVLEARHLVSVVVPVDLQVEVAAVESAERVIAVHAEGQVPVVVGFVGNGRARQFDRARRFDAQEVSLSLHQQEGFIELKCDGFAAWIIVRAEFGGEGGRQNGGGIGLSRQGHAQRLGGGGHGENVREQDFRQRAVCGGGEGRHVWRAAGNDRFGRIWQGLGCPVGVAQVDRRGDVLVDPARSVHARFGTGVDAEEGEGPDGGENQNNA